MITNKLKKLFYFPFAYYFRFFAQIQLLIWKPRIIVVTGSSGKTTLLHLIESQLGEKAKYSHQANSSFGIPFDILGLHRKDLTIGEWPYLFLAAPFRVFRKPPKEKLYVVEADCDRPYEGKFLASLLRPEITLWTNVSRTHTVNFDSRVVIARSSALQNDEAISTDRLPHQSADWFVMTKEGRKKTTLETTFGIEEVIAHEFGYFLEYTSKLVVINGDSKLIKHQLNRSKASVKSVTQKHLTAYKVFKDYTDFKINEKIYSINALLPKKASLSIQMTLILLDYLKIKPNLSFSKFSLPPGRCSLFKGIKNTTIIDGSYNATPDGMKAILDTYDLYPADKKWVVIGDMVELGNEEQEEHEKLADIINAMKLDKIILVGPRLSKYTYPKLKYFLNCHPEFISGSRSLGFEMPKQVRHDTVRIEKFIMSKDALDYLLTHLRGGEAILFKGARFLEGIIEHLLTDKNDVRKLSRREKVWQERRKKWGL